MASLRLAAQKYLRQTCVPQRQSSRSDTRMFSKSHVGLGDPSHRVCGVTQTDIEQDARIAAYFAANFPDRKEDEAADMVADAESSINKDAEENESEASFLNIRSLFCYKRDEGDEEGSRRSRRLRAEGFIPGLLYGGDPKLDVISKDPVSKSFVKTPWNQIHRELGRYHRHFESRVYDLTVFEDSDDTVGSVHRVLPRDVQRHPLQNKVYCVNYLRYFPGRPIKIPIVYINEEESPALKRDGFIVPVNRFVECVVEDGVPIPKSLELECTDLRRKEVIRMSRIIFPEGVTPSWRIKDPDQFLIGTVFGRTSAEIDEENEEIEEEKTTEE